MARRVVSYSDIDDGSVASIASTSMLVNRGNGTSTSDASLYGATFLGGNDGVEPKTNAGNGKGKRKRKGGKTRQKASHMSARLSGMDRSNTAHPGGVHWDDPSYVPVPSGRDQESWIQEGPHAKKLIPRQPNTLHSDDASPAEHDDEFFDAYSDSPESSISGSDSSYGQLEANNTGSEAVLDYTAWKYDENGDPYTGATAFGEQDEDFDDEEAWEEEVDEEDDVEQCSYNTNGDEEEDEVADIGFLIPDLDGFNRAWQAKHGTSTMQNDSIRATGPTRQCQPQNRPPVEVGGGGRMLTQSEIWGPTAITDAWTAAVQQFSDAHGPEKHSLEPDSKAEEAKHTVVEDAESPTTLSQTDKMGNNHDHASPLWHDAPGHDSLLAKQIQLDTEQILQLKAQRKQKQKVPPSTTDVVGSSEPSISTATSTVIPASDAPNASHGGSGSGQTRVPSGKLSGNHAWKRAVKTVRNTPNSIGVATADKSEPGKSASVDVKMLHEYWYAGYYAGLAQAQSQDTAQHPTVPTLKPREE